MKILELMSPVLALYVAIRNEYRSWYSLFGIDASQIAVVTTQSSYDFTEYRLPVIPNKATCKLNGYVGSQIKI